MVRKVEGREGEGCVEWREGGQEDWVDREGRQKIRGGRRVGGGREGEG